MYGQIRYEGSNPSPSAQSNLICSENMKEVYEKLLKNLTNMTPEEKEKEWEELKKYNDIGPSIKEIN